MNAQNRLGRIGCYGAGIVGVLGLTAFPVSACQLDPGDVVITDIGARSVVEIDAGTGRSCPISVGGLLELPVGLADRNDKPGKLTERPFGLSRSAAADFEMGDGASCGSSR